MRAAGATVRKRIAMATCALAAMMSIAAPSARAQTPPVEPPAMSPQWSPALRGAVDRLADSARVAGISSAPLYLKAAEGVLKRAPDERVAAAVRRLLDELREARRNLGPSATDAELVAGASVLHAGLDAGALRRVRDARRATRPDGSLVMPLVVLADLVARHVTPDVATASVAALTERGAPDGELASLRAHIEREIGRGESPDGATRARTAAILRAVPANEPRDGPTPLDPRMRP